MTGEISARTHIPKLRRVLAATDLSELSNRAIPHAYSMLQEGGTVRIVHVEQSFEFANPIHAPVPVAVQRLEEERQRQINECRNRLRALVPVEAESRGIETEIEVLHQSKPAAAICAAAERFEADLICMASHGRSGISKIIVGSVAQVVLACTQIPVLLIRQRESAEIHGTRHADTERAS
jgi:nucleotide-binding universal stress UspA family protein